MPELVKGRIPRKRGSGKPPIKDPKKREFSLFFCFLQLFLKNVLTYSKLDVLIYIESKNGNKKSIRNIKKIK